MRHALYSCSQRRRGSGAVNIGHTNQSVTRGNTVNYMSNTKDPMDMLIKSKLDAVLKKYDEDSAIRANVCDRVNMYLINRKIAEEFSDKKTIRRLRKELLEYLNKI